jgi:hypothetical protein
VSASPKFGLALAATILLVAASSACKRKETLRGDGAPAPSAARPPPAAAPPAAVAAPPPACDKSPIIARGLAKLFGMKPNAWSARPGRFPDPACAVVALAGENCLDHPDQAAEAEADTTPRRFVGVMDPITGAPRAGEVEELSGLGEACFSNEWISAALDLDGDGTDELVMEASSSHHAENFDSATVFRVRNKRVSRIGWVPVRYEAVGRADDEEPIPTCEGSLSVIAAGAPGGPALELVAKVDGKGELTKQQCLPGRRRFRAVGDELVATQVPVRRGGKR